MTGVPCAGAVVRDGHGRLLLIQRGQPPQQGSWSLPGGRIEPGETPAVAAAREVAEETGLTVTVGRLLGRISVGPYEVWDFAATVTGDGSAPRAASDAAAARWVTPAELPDLRLSTGLLEALISWGVLPDPGRLEDAEDPGFPTRG